MSTNNYSDDGNGGPVVTLCTWSIDEASATMHAHQNFPWVGCPDRMRRATWLEHEAQKIIDANGWDGTVSRTELLKAAAALLWGTPS